MGGVDHLANSVNDWMFAVATASVPILTFIVVMYVLFKIHFLTEQLTKVEIIQAQHTRDILELTRAVASMQATLQSLQKPPNL